MTEPPEVFSSLNAPPLLPDHSLDEEDEEDELETVDEEAGDEEGDEEEDMEEGELLPAGSHGVPPARPAIDDLRGPDFCWNKTLSSGQARVISMMSVLVKLAISR